MKERPMLFSGPMVRAILDGRKTQTRRIIKPQPKFVPRWLDEGHWYGLRCPYGEPGDRLWVRETWAAPHKYDALPPRLIPVGTNIHYRSTWEGPCGLRWRPSIHMPRWASRVTLEITNIRAERLHDISWDDALAEGIDRLVDRYDEPDVWRDYSSEGPPEYTSDPIESYATLWESIHGSGAWDKNPWVWVLEFARVEAGR